MKSGCILELFKSLDDKRTPHYCGLGTAVLTQVF